MSLLLLVVLVGLGVGGYFGVQQLKRIGDLLEAHAKPPVPLEATAVQQQMMPATPWPPSGQPVPWGAEHQVDPRRQWGPS